MSECFAWAHRDIIRWLRSVAECRAELMRFRGRAVPKVLGPPAGPNYASSLVCSSLSLNEN